MAMLEKWPEQKGRLDSPQPTLMAQLVELQEENARLREDAERYRAKRQRDFISSGAANQKVYYIAYDKTCDYMIDAARKEQK